MRPEVATPIGGVACGGNPACAWNLKAARNEFESFQITVEAGDQAISGLTVEYGTATLTGPGPAIPNDLPNVVLYREVNYTVGPPCGASTADPGCRRPADGGTYDQATYKPPSDGEGAQGNWPDALIPKRDYFYGEARNGAGGFTLTTLNAHDKATFWVDVLAPDSQPAGLYTGSLNVSATSGLTGGPIPVTINLTVRGFRIDSTAHLASAFPANPDRNCFAHTLSGNCGDVDREWALSSLYARAGLENRLSNSYPWPVGLDSLAPTGLALSKFRSYILPLIQGANPTPPAGHAWTAIRLMPDASGKGPQLTALNIYAFLGWHCGFTPACVSSWESLAQNPDGDPGTTDSFLSRMFLYACEEPTNNANRWTQPPGSGGLCYALDHVTTSMAKLATAGAQDALANNRITHIDIMTPPVNYLDGKTCCGDRFPNNQRGQQVYSDFLPPPEGNGTYDQPGSPPNRLWMYTACGPSYGCNGPPVAGWNTSFWNGWPSYAIDQVANPVTELTEARPMGWLSFAYRVTGELYFKINEQLETAWTNSYNNEDNLSDPPSTYGNGNGDGTLFYPGIPAGRGSPGDLTYAPAIGGTHEIPIESVRLKRIRDAREDYEYLYVAAQQPGGRTPVESIIKTRFCPAAPDFPTCLNSLMYTPLDDAQLVLARDEVAALIPSTGLTPGRIAFTSDRDGNNKEIWVMNDDGTGTPLPVTTTFAPVSNTQPSWSPDGARIVYTRTSGGNDDLWTVNADGTNATALLATPASESKPSWSPDGNRIAFVRNTGGGDDVYVARDDGTYATALAADPAGDYDADWERFGNEVAFTSTRTGSNGADLYVTTSDLQSPSVSHATDAAGDDDGVDWAASPSDSNVLFGRFGSDYDVWRADPFCGPGCELNLATSPGTHEYYPTWMRNGAYAFVRGLGAGAELYKSSSAYGPPPTPSPLTVNGFLDTEPDWTPPAGTAAQPINDSFFRRLDLRGFPGPTSQSLISVSLSMSNVGAGKEAGEPSVAGNAGGHSVWFTWTAARAANATIDLAGSSFDTLLAVYTGSSVDALTLVASNDDTAPGTTSRVVFAAAAGTTYHIVVDGKNGVAGAYRLAAALPVAGPTAVRLLSFRALRTPSGVRVSWRVASEVDVLGYKLLRAAPGKAARLVKRVSVRGRTYATAYRVVDRSAPQGATYLLRVVTKAGIATLARTRVQS